MIFTLVPMILQIVFSIGLSACTSVTGGTFMLVLSAIAALNLSSGSIYTINYEIDPKNSAVLISIFSSCGQLFGFLGSMLMAAIKTTNVDIEDFESVYRQKWAIFFWIAGFAGMGFWQL